MKKITRIAIILFAVVLAVAMLTMAVPALASGPPPSPAISVNPTHGLADIHATVSSNHGFGYYNDWNLTLRFESTDFGGVHITGNHFNDADVIIPPLATPGVRTISVGYYSFFFPFSWHTIASCGFTVDPSPPPTYTLTVSVVGNGTVTPTVGDHTYPSGTVVDVSSTPAPGWSFAGWAGEVVSGQVTMNGNKTITATFTQNEYSLAIVCNPLAGGSVGVSSGPPYHYGDSVTMTPTANPGYTFTGFSTSNPVIITDNTTVTATFTQDEYSLTVNVVGSGSVAVSSEPPYHYGDTVTLTPTPGMGYHFVGFDTANPVTITGNIVVTATFAIDKFALTYTAGPHGTITGNCTQVVDYLGSGTTVTAVADSGYTFSGWSDGVMTDSRTDTDVTHDISVTAYFGMTPAQSYAFYNMTWLYGLYPWQFNVRLTDIDSINIGYGGWVDYPAVHHVLTLAGDAAGHDVVVKAGRYGIRVPVGEKFGLLNWIYYLDIKVWESNQDSTIHVEWYNIYGIGMINCHFNLPITIFRTSDNSVIFKFTDIVWGVAQPLPLP